MAVLIYFLNVVASVASASGYVMSTLFNYWANSQFAFGGGHSHRRSFPRFLLTAITGLGINQLILITGIYLSLHLVIAQLAATTIVFFWNYFINAVWTFAKRDYKL